MLPVYRGASMKKHVRKKQWFDQDTFWRKTFPFMFPEKRFAVAAETIVKILKLTKVRGKTALDLCCGPGRCSIALAKRGFSVTGVDRTKYLLDEARTRARAAGVNVEWIQQDMRDFVRPNAYHLVLSMFTSFGYFENREEDSVVLANVYKCLRPGGAFFIDLMGKEILARSFVPASAQTLPNGSTLLEQRSIVSDWNRISNDWTIIQNGTAERFTLELNLYSGQELREKMERVGLVDVKLYGDIDGESYGPEAKRLIAVGWKPRALH
jgi:2-polyprenyl-3-methyl-5-hydroxy-6-metoxy-1,4-benzoquinol methylase